jgi:hypothetical protein
LLVQNPAKWSAFVKSVLKNGLKMRELGPPCVALLAALCASKYSGLQEENKEQQLIADMLQSHSGDLIPIQCCGSMTFFGVDPDPRVHATDTYIRILLFLSLTFKRQTRRN